MASSKRPPLELDELTNNLKQSSGKGVDAFFSAPATSQEEKKPVMQEGQDKGIHPFSDTPQPRTGEKQSTNGKKPANLQTRKRAKLSLAPALPDSEMVEKYTTHVEPSLVKKVQIEAIEREINDYDVVRIALKEYFEK